MEHVPGVQLHDKWPAMNPHQHMLCVKHVTLMMTEMAKLPFPAYGSLYFADVELDSKSKIELANGFCLGPHCGAQYWDCNAGEPRYYDERPPNRGPCELIYLSSLHKTTSIDDANVLIVRDGVKFLLLRPDRYRLFANSKDHYDNG